MAEHPPPDYLKFKSPGAMLDLFYLTALFIADEKVTKRVFEPVSEQWSEHLEHEVCLRLSSTAAILRARDDYLAAEVAEQNDEGVKRWAEELRSTMCGSFQPDVNSDRSAVLNMREACNKIIQARRYEFKVAGDPRYLDPIVYLYGSHKGREWGATLDILLYVDAGIQYTSFN